MIIGGNGDRTDGDASWAAYNPATDSWRELPDPPIRAGGVYAGTWTGTEVIFTKARETGTSVYALNPNTGEWRQVANPGRTLSQTSSVWTGDYIIYWGETGHPGRPLTQVAYDPVADTWTQLNTSPLTPRFAHQSTTVIGPNTVLIWGGADYGPEGFSDGAILVLEGPGSDDSPRADADLISSLFPLAGDLSRAADVAWDPTGVALGLGETIIRMVDPVELVEPATWTLDIDSYNGTTGPISVLDGINLLAGIDDMQLNEGPHDHCASPPKLAPPGYEGLRRVSVQPWVEGCLQWWTIDLFVTGDGLIKAITYDFWQP
jgi:hypothetical protein